MANKKVYGFGENKSKIEVATKEEVQNKLDKTGLKGEETLNFEGKSILHLMQTSKMKIDGAVQIVDGSENLIMAQDSTGDIIIKGRNGVNFTGSHVPYYNGIPLAVDNDKQNKILSGTSEPATSLGSNGDIYIMYE